MKKLIIALVALAPFAAHAEYQQVNLKVFGMDCAPCAHAIHVSMKAIPGVDTVAVDLNTGLVSVHLKNGNAATISQFNTAVEKNGFTHQDATVTVKGRVTGTEASPVFEVTGTGDRYPLVSSASAPVAGWLGRSVQITGTLPAAANGKLPQALSISVIKEAQ